MRELTEEELKELLQDIVDWLRTCPKCSYDRGPNHNNFCKNCGYNVATDHFEEK